MEFVIIEALTVTAWKVQMPGVNALNRVLQILTNHAWGVDLKLVNTHIIWSVLKYFKVNYSAM